MSKEKYREKPNTIPEEESTTHLEQVLKNVSSIKAAQSMAEEHAKEQRPFHVLFNEYVAEHGLNAAEVYRLSGINLNSVYGIANGRTRHPGRDKLLALCIACGMSTDELNRTLRSCGVNALYPKNRRDIMIAGCISSGMREVVKINLVLDEEGLEPLKV